MRVIAPMLVLSLLCIPVFGASIIEGYPVGIVVVETTGSVDRSALPEWKPVHLADGYTWSTTIDPRGMRLIILVQIIDPETGFEKRLAFGSTSTEFNLDLGADRNRPPVTLSMFMSEDGGLTVATSIDNRIRTIHSGDSIRLDGLEGVTVTYHGVVPDTWILRHEHMP